MSPEKTKQRLTHIDCMRGLACILMFQTHCYDSWLEPAARTSIVYRWSQFASTLTAPSFLFLAGFSIALALEGLARRGASGTAAAGMALRRGAEILLLGLLFRAQDFFLGWPLETWTDLLRVDVLNGIGVSIMLLALVCWIRPRAQRGAAAAAGALGVAMLAPPLWTTWRPRWLPWYLESYVNGVHTFSKPQPWLFPIFPWAAFCFAGLAVATLMRSAWARRRENLSMALVATGGVLLGGLALLLDWLPLRLYREHDFWHTSPNFFLVRLGILILILAVCYAWSRHSERNWAFNRLLQLGQASLAVYWVHIEFVYGRISILPKRASSIALATAGLLVIVAAMCLLANVRVWLKAKKGMATQAQRPREANFEIGIEQQEVGQ